MVNSYFDIATGQIFPQLSNPMTKATLGRTMKTKIGQNIKHINIHSKARRTFGDIGFKLILSWATSSLKVKSSVNHSEPVFLVVKSQCLRGKPSMLIVNHSIYCNHNQHLVVQSQESPPYLNHPGISWYFHVFPIVKSS